MKKQIILFVAALLATLPLPGQERVVERTYIATDKDVYVAGERVWCSAFCVTPSGALSEVSRVAYLELHGAGALAATARIDLEKGRGAGALELPGTLPTGNYRLIAYTAQNKAEEGYDYEGLAAKTLSVFNVLTTERLKDGVEVVSEEAYAELLAERSRVKPGMTTNAPGMTTTAPGMTTNAPGMTDVPMIASNAPMMGGGDDRRHPGLDPGSVQLRWENGRLQLVNRSGEALTLSLSVYHDDGILPNANPGIGDFLADCRKVGERRFDDTVLPDYEGEVIRGRVVGFSPEMLPRLTGKYAFISSPSDKSDVYAAPIGEDGSLVFFTGNIYGNKECICEIEGIEPGLNCHIELNPPYVNAAVAAAPALPVSASLADALRLRSVGMQLERRFAADTLYEFLPRPTDGLFDENVVVRYVLDDYTRFPTMAEIFVEFIPEIRARRGSDGRRDIQVRLSEAASMQTFSSGSALMMLDGVPVFDHEKIMQYDPLLVESIDIYPHTHFVSNRAFEGVVNFVTYKRNLPSFPFDADTRVVDYEGVCVPMAFTGAALEGDYPDYRQTIYWHPLLQVDAAADLEIECRKPLYGGRFTAVVEGMTASGKAVSSRISFDLR